MDKDSHVKPPLKNTMKMRSIYIGNNIKIKLAKNKTKFRCCNTFSVSQRYFYAAFGKFQILWKFI